MFETFIHTTTKITEVCGIAIIIGGALIAAYHYVKQRNMAEVDGYDLFRRKLGRSILLGLELLVAADIINTVAIEPTMESVLILGLIVLIRTFLSFSIEIELEGKLPWRSRKD